jgi:outer membrane autotransporter protein
MAWGGAQVGLERALDHHTLLGFYGGYAGARVTADAPRQSTQFNGGQFGAYFRRARGRHYWLAIGGFGFRGYHSRRGLQFGGVHRAAAGDYAGWQSAAYLERGATFRWRACQLQPLVALQYLYLRQNGFTETGAGAANLAVSGIDTHSLRIIPGVRLRRFFATPGGSLTPEFRALWMHEFLDAASLVTTRFAATPGAGFTVRGADSGRDWALLGAGLNWQANQRLSLYAGYNLQINARQAFHLGSGGLQYRW